MLASLRKPINFFITSGSFKSDSLSSMSSWALSMSITGVKSFGSTLISSYLFLAVGSKKSPTALSVTYFWFILKPSLLSTSLVAWESWASSSHVDENPTIVILSLFLVIACYPYCKPRKSPPHIMLKIISISWIETCSILSRWSFN